MKKFNLPRALRGALMAGVVHGRVRWRASLPRLDAPDSRWPWPRLVQGHGADTGDTGLVQGTQG